MPVYEYRCATCRRKSSVFVRTPSSPARPACQHCGGASLTRLFSTFAVRREAGGDDFGDDTDLGDIDESDPKSVARMMRKMGQESGEDLGPEFNEMVGRMEAGEMPEEPDGGLGGDGGLDGGEGDDDFAA